MNLKFVAILSCLAVAAVAIICEQRALAEGAACPQACNTEANCTSDICKRIFQEDKDDPTQSRYYCWKTIKAATPGKVCGDKKEGETEGCTNNKTVVCGKLQGRVCSATSITCTPVEDQPNQTTNGCTP
jgi:hypothetical protein